MFDSDGGFNRHPETHTFCSSADWTLSRGGYGDLNARNGGALRSRPLTSPQFRPAYGTLHIDWWGLYGAGGPRATWRCHEEAKYAISVMNWQLFGWKLEAGFIESQAHNPRR